MLKCLFFALHIPFVVGQHMRPSLKSTVHRHPRNSVQYDQASQELTTKPARLRGNLPVFELICGQGAEYELDRALAETMTVRGRPLAAWPHELQPDLTNFSWMVYDKKRQVLSGTPPVTQPAFCYPGALSYLDVYIYIGNDRSYRFRSVLGISVRPRIISDFPDSSSTATSIADVSNSTSEINLRPHGVVLGMLVAAFIFLLLLVLGGLGWLIATRKYLKNPENTTARGQQAQSSLRSEPRGHSDIPYWRQPESDALPLTSTGITSARRRVRTADPGASPTAPSLQHASVRSSRTTPEKSPLSGTRKRAATLLQTIHTRAIRGSPRIGASKGTLASQPEVAGSERRTPSPELGSGIGLPEITPIADDEVKERQFTNSWCSALQLDPFQSPGLSIELSKIDSQRWLSERPASPTPEKGMGASGDRTMSMSELQSSGTTMQRSSPFEHEGNAFCASLLSPTSLGSSKETAVSRTNRVLPTNSSLERSKVGSLSREQSYAERTNLLGMALLALPPTSDSTQQPLGLSFDSFFSPSTIGSKPPALDEAEPRYGDVSSERMVKIGRSQETLATVYVTASETGASPVNFGPATSSMGHEVPENIGIIGSPSTLHSQMVELDDISSPQLDPEAGALVATGSMSQDLKESVSNQSLSVEYGRGDHSLRTLNSFPTIMRGSLSCFPQDVELSTPVIPSDGLAGLPHREPSDIMLLPADDLSLGCIRLTRVEDGSDPGLESEIVVDEVATSIRSTEDSILSAGEKTSRSEARTEEDSILSPNLSQKTSENDDSIMEKEASAADSIVSEEVDRSSNGLRYASQLFIQGNSL